MNCNEEKCCNQEPCQKTYNVSVVYYNDRVYSYTEPRLVTEEELTSLKEWVDNNSGYYLNVKADYQKFNVGKLLEQIEQEEEEKRVYLQLHRKYGFR